jgi:hypothetical protein
MEGSADKTAVLYNELRDSYVRLADHTANRASKLYETMLDTPLGLGDVFAAGAADEAVLKFSLAAAQATAETAMLAVAEYLAKAED